MLAEKQLYDSIVSLSESIKAKKLKVEESTKEEREREREVLQKLSQARKALELVINDNRGNT